MRVLALLAVLAFSIGAAQAQPYFADLGSTETRWALSRENRVTSDSEYVGKHYGNRMAFFFQDNKTAKHAGIVFLGDSITEGFPLDLAFNGLDQPEGHVDNIVNRGISGDHIEGMIMRLDVCVRDLQPCLLYVMAGTNDVWWVRKDYVNGNVKVGYERLVKRVKELSPDTEIIFQTMLPINGVAEPKTSWDLYGQWVATANEQIREVAQANGIKVIDTNKALSDENGYMLPRYTSDGIHLTLLGYLRWIDEMDLPFDEKMQVWKNLSKMWEKQMIPQAQLAGKNRNRWTDELIMFVLDATTTCTGTNAFGVEVMVQDDKVTSISRSGNMTLPADGYVLSGHGDAAAWLLNVATVGATVKIVGNDVNIHPGTDPDKMLVYEAIRAQLMLAMARDKEGLEKYYEPVEKVRKGDLSFSMQLLEELKIVVSD